MTRLALHLSTALLLTLALAGPALAEDAKTSVVTEAEPLTEAGTEVATGVAAELEVDLGIDLEKNLMLRLELEAACAESSETSTLAPNVLETLLPTTGIATCDSQQEAYCGCPACVVINDIVRCFC